MKITYKGDYALKALLDISLQGSGLVNIKDISERQDIPLKFLEQILLSLKKGGFLKSKRGKSGGYSLAKDPGKITVGDVIRHIEGPIEPISCVFNKGKTQCNYSSTCVFYDLFCEIGKYIAQKVDGVTFSDLVEKHKKKLMSENKYLNYSI